MPLQGCIKLVNLITALKLLWKGVFGLYKWFISDFGDTHKPDEKTVRTFDSSLQWHQILLSCFSLESSAGGPAQFRQIAPFSGEEMDETAALIQSLHHHHHFNSAVLPELPTERPKWFFSAGSLFPFSPFSRLKSVCSPESGPRVAPPRLTLTGWQVQGGTLDFTP